MMNKLVKGIAVLMAVCGFAGVASAAGIFTAEPSSVVVAVGETVSVTLTNNSGGDVEPKMGSNDKNGEVTTREFDCFTATFPSGSRKIGKNGGTQILNITGTTVTSEPQTLTFYKDNNNYSSIQITVIEKRTVTFQGQEISYVGATCTTADNGDLIMKFTDSGWLELPATGLVDYLVVGGGGSGGTTDGNAKFATSGNGGAVKVGEFVVFSKDTYSVTVGKGGDAQTAKKTAGNDGGASSIVGTAASFTAAGGAGGAGGSVSETTGNAGSPAVGTENAITGEAVVYGTGGAPARKYKDAQNRDVTEVAEPGAANTGNGGMAGGTSSGAGGSGIVYVRVRALKEAVSCGSVTTEVTESVMIPHDTRWGDTWTVFSADPSLATATVSGSDVTVTGLGLGTTKVMVMNEAQIFIYDLTVTKLSRTKDVFVSTLDAETLLGEIVGEVESVTIGSEAIVSTVLRDGKLYAVPGTGGTTTVIVETALATYVYRVTVDRVINKTVELLKGASSGSSYSYEFDSIRGIEGDGNGVITIAQDGNKVIFTAVQPGTASVQVYGAVDGGQDSVLNYTVVVKETSGEIATIDGVPVVYTGAAEAKKVGDDLVLVYTNTANVGTFEIPVPYMATVDILAVGGGGGGGSTLTFGDGAGGGGAGGVSEVDGKKFSGGIYTVKVGKGGAAGDSGTFAAPAVGSNGGDSFITNAVGYAYASAKGGGGGGAGANPAAAGGQNGGSGGGSVWYNGVCGTPGRGISGQGAAGGAPSVNGQGGGGGGAGSVGGADRMGGKGETNDITGVSIVYAQGGMGGLDDTQKLADEVSGPGFGGNGGNGGPGSSGADGVVIVRITDIIRNIKVPIPTTNDIFRTGFVWEAGKTYSGLVYDDTTTFCSSTDAHPYRWIDAIDKVEGVTSTNCLFSAEGTKLGIGYHNFKITLKPGFSWEDDGGRDSYGTMGALSCRWTVRDADTVDLAEIDVTKSVTWTDSSNATISITTFTTPESAGARRDGVLVLGSLCFSHGFYSNIYDRALSAIAEVSDADYHWWYAEPPYQPGKNASYMQGNTNENGTAISGHLTKGEPYVYPWGSVGNSHDTGGQHETLFYFLDMLDKVRLAEQSGGKKYGYIVFSFDSDALAYGDYVQDQIAALKEVALRDGDTERYALYDAINPKSKTVAHPHVQEIAEWLAENFYKEGSVIWLDATNGSFSPSGDLMPILNPYSYLNGGAAHSATTIYPDSEYWTEMTVTTNVNKKTGVYTYETNYTYNVFQNQTYYGDADEVAKLLKSKIKVKPYNMELTDKIVSPEKGLTITSMTVQACTNGVDNVASTNETDWIDLLAWDRASGKGVFLPTSLEEGLGIPGASLEVDIVSNTTRTVVSNVDFKVWTRVKINVLDDGKFRTSTDATFNEMTGKWEKNPNEGKAYAEMIDPNGGISMHVDGDAETQVPWSFEAYPVTAIVHNGQAFVGGEDQLEQSIGEGGSCSVYYRGNGGYRIAKIIVDDTDVYEGAALVDYEYSYTFSNIASPHKIEIFYESFFGTVESAPVTNVYDNAVHLFDVKREGWDESISNEVRYALWKDREDSTKYYTAEEFKRIYEAEYGTDYNPDELTDVGDHEIAYRVFALQKGYGKTFTEEGWVWVESETWEDVGEGCGVDHSVILPAPLTVRPESHKTIGAEDELPKIGIDIKGLIDGEMLEDVIGHDATNSWSVTSNYKVPMGEGLYPTWVIDGEGQKLVAGDPSMITPDASTVDGNVGNYYLLPTDNFIPVVKIPIEIGGVPQGPGLDPEQPSMNTGVGPVIKPYDGVETGLVVEVTSEWPAGSGREGQPLVEGTDYTITWAIGNLDDPSTPPASGINDPNEPMFLHAGTNVVWYYVQTTPTSEADGLYFAASNYNYVIITPIPLVLESPSKTWRYTGETFSFDEVKVVDGTKLVDGDTLDAHTTASIKDVGSVTNVFNYKIVTGHPDAEHPNGNGDYDVTVRYGELTVTPTNITIGEKDYPLDPNEKVKYGDTGVEDVIRVYDGIPTNIVVDVKVPEEGKYEIRYCWSTNGVDKTEWSTELPLFTNVVDAVVYFEVTPINEYSNDYVPASGFARVIVTPAEVTVKADDKYIAVGDPQPVYTATVGHVVPGNEIAYNTPTCPTYTDALGEYPIMVTGEECQGNYQVTYEPGTLHVVDEATVVIHYVDEDGKPLLDDKTFVSALGTTVDATDYVENVRHYRVKELPSPTSVGAVGLELTIVYGPPDYDIPPTQNDDPDKPSTHGDVYPNDLGQDGNPGYKVVNDPDEPWEVTSDPKAGTEGENPSDDPGENKVATTTEWVPPGGTTRVRYEVENDGEFRWDSLIQPGTGTTPASVTVLVDGVTNFVYVASDDDPMTTDDGTEWTPHVIHVEGDTEPGHPHIIELVFTNDDGDGTSKVSIDDVTWLPAVPDEKMAELVTKIDVPDTIAPEDPRRVVKIDNDNPSGWVPATYGGDDGKKLVGVRSTDGSELVKTVGDEDVKVLESTITINVTGSGELKIGEILFSEVAEDGGMMTIRVDGKEYPLDPGDDPTDITNTVISVCGGGNVEHTVEIVYMRESSDTAVNSSCEVRDIQWKTFAESDEGGSDWLKDEGVALWIVDHEERDDGRCYLAFEPQLKVKEEFLDWLRRTRDYNHVYVKYGRTWKECDECVPVRAFAREHRKEKGEYYRDCGDGERDAAKGWMWIQVDLPKTTVLPLGYWRVYIDEAEIDFAYGGKVKTVYVDDATGEPIPGVEPFGAFSLPRNTKVAARPRTIPGYLCVSEPPVTNGVIETDQEIVFTYRYAKETSYTVRYLERGAYPERELAPAKVVPEQQAGSSVTEWALDIDGYVLSDDFDKTITLTANPDANEIVFYYEPRPQPREVEYIVRYMDEDGVWGDLIAPKHCFGYEGDIIIEIAETIPGFRARERKIQFQLQEYPDGQVMVIIFYYWMEK